MIVVIVFTTYTKHNTIFQAKTVIYTSNYINLKCSQNVTYRYRFVLFTIKRDPFYLKLSSTNFGKNGSYDHRTASRSGG